MNEQEQRWIRAARGGDEAAFGELVRLYQKRVYALAVRLCPTPELAEEVSPFITGCLLTAEEMRLLKAADRLSALVKCMEEQRSGNHEFDAALRQQREALEGMHCPESDWFMAHCLPCFTQNLDELTRSE